MIITDSTERKKEPTTKDTKSRVFFPRFMILVMIELQRGENQETLKRLGWKEKEKRANETLEMRREREIEIPRKPIWRCFCSVLERNRSVAGLWVSERERERRREGGGERRLCGVSFKTWSFLDGGDYGGNLGQAKPELWILKLGSGSGMEFGFWNPCGIGVGLFRFGTDPNELLDWICHLDGENLWALVKLLRWWYESPSS